MTRNFRQAWRGLLFAAAALAVALGWDAQVFAAPPPKAEEFRPLDLRQVKLGGEMGRRIDNTIVGNLLVIDVDRDFLDPLKHPLDKSDNDAYFALGKLIDAAVKLAAYSGDDKVLARKRHIVETALAAQEPDGYLGYLKPPLRMKTLWDVHEMSYLIQGLVSDHRWFGEERSLEAAKRIAGYLIAHWKEIPPDWPRQTEIATDVGCTGLELAMLALAHETGDRRYIDFCIGPRRLAAWHLDIVVGRRPLIEGHSYAYLSRCLAQRDLFDLQKEKNLGLFAQSNKAWEFMVRGNGMAITGGCGQWECWSNDQDGRGALGETCSTAEQIRLADRLQRRGPGSSVAADVMERTIFNALFCAQSPDGRKIRYYAPFEGPRKYYPVDTYCCPCNFRRITSELPSMVYYQGPKAVMVNLYTPSTAKDIRLGPDEGSPRLTVRQETDYPNSGKVTLRVDPSKETTFTLYLRIPRWCPRATVSINGRAERGPFTPGSYAGLSRQWKAGDRVNLSLDMPWRLVLGRRRQAGRVAVMRGPVVFGIDPLHKENAAHKKTDGVDLGRITLAPTTIKGPLACDDVRPNGLACRIKAFLPGYDVEKPNTQVYLTEFPDPDCRAIYFRLQDVSQGVPDELLGASPP